MPDKKSKLEPYKKLSKSKQIILNVEKIKNDIENSPNKQLTFINYTQFCNYLELPIFNGSQKPAQLKNLHKLLDYEMFKKEDETYLPNSPYGFVIYDIYCNIIDPKDIKFLYHYRNYLNNKSGVYKIYNDDKIYIGSSKNLYLRFMDHYRNYQNECTKTHNVLINNGVFEVIELFDNIDETNKFDKELQTKEYEYIKDYIFNYSIGLESRTLINSVIPDKNGNLINLGKANPFKTKKGKVKYSKIKINQDDFDIVISLLNSNNIDYEILKK